MSLLLVFMKEQTHEKRSRRENVVNNDSHDRSLRASDPKHAHHLTVQWNRTPEQEEDFVHPDCIESGVFCNMNFVPAVDFHCPGIEVTDVPVRSTRGAHPSAGSSVDTHV